MGNTVYMLIHEKCWVFFGTVRGKCPSEFFYKGKSTCLLLFDAITNLNCNNSENYHMNCHILFKSFFKPFIYLGNIIFVLQLIL